MGYWVPPPPSAYDPTPRPLSWHWEGAVRVPDPPDAILFGIGVAEGVMQSALPGDRPMYTRHMYNLPNNPGLAATFRGKSTAELLDAYGRLIDVRAPEDPPTGGLAADHVDPTGAIHVNYWDLADGRQPHRKQVVFAPKAGGVEVAVYQWNHDAQEWRGEGFDFERDFSGSVYTIMDALNAVTTAIVSIFATPAVGAAWSAAFGAGLNLSRKQRAGTLTIDDALGESFGALASFGAGVGIGEALASESGRALTGSLYKAIGVAQKDVGDFAAAIGKVAAEGGKLIPKVKAFSVEAALAGAIPPDILSHSLAPWGASAPPKPIDTIPSTLAYEWKLATTAYAALRAGAPSGFYGWRKLSVQPDVFDASVASLAATEAAEDASREFQARTFFEARDPQATATWRTALARAKQAVAPKDDATATWRSVQGKATADFGVVPIAAAPPARASAIRTVAAVSAGAAGAYVLWLAARAALR